MPDSPTAGKTLLQRLLAGASPGTAGLLQQSGLRALKPPAAPTEPSLLSDDEKLNIFDSVLDELASEKPAEPELSGFVQEVAEPELNDAFLATAMPLAVQQAAQNESQQQQGGARKETLEGGRGTAVVEAAPTTAGVEVERSAEISPEVESYIEEVRDQTDTQPEDIVIAEVVLPTQPQVPATRVVKVLPLTKAQSEVAKHKSPAFSIRWLYEFSDKIAKIFAGSVTYRPES